MWVLMTSWQRRVNCMRCVAEAMVGRFWGVRSSDGSHEDLPRCAIVPTNKFFTFEIFRVSYKFPVSPQNTQRAVFMAFSQRVKIEESLFPFAAFPDAHEPTARKFRRIPRSSNVLRQDATVLDMSREITRRTEVCPAVHGPTSQRVNLEMVRILSPWGQSTRILLIMRFSFRLRFLFMRVTRIGSVFQSFHSYSLQSR